MKLLLSPTGTPPCPQSHSPASAGPHGPAPVPRMLREGARHRTRGCGRHAVGHHPGREGCSGWLTPPTPKSHLRPHKLIARLPALAAKPSQNSWLLILTRSGGTRRFTASTACSPRAVRKDSGPHSRPSSLFCSPETRTGCRGSWGSAGPGLGGGGGGPRCHRASPGKEGGSSPGPSASAPGRVCSCWRGRGRAARAARWVPGCSGRRGGREDQGGLGGSTRPPLASPGSFSPPHGR